MQALSGNFLTSTPKNSHLAAITNTKGLKIFTVCFLLQYRYTHLYNSPRLR